MKKFVLLACVAIAALAVAAPAVTASHARPGAHIAKKCKKKKRAAEAKKKCKKKPPPVPALNALTDAEVISRVQTKANEYCTADPACFSYGYYPGATPAQAGCASKSTYTWSCYGFNLKGNENDPITCRFLEIVERTATNGVTSHQDLTFGVNGWECS
jgi:hypothetical protein